MSGIIDLSQLPAPDIVETVDFEVILAERKAYYLSLFPKDEQAAVAATLTLESEPVVKLLQENAYREMVLRQRVNDAGRALLLAYAKSKDLEQIAANYNVKRLTITKADNTTVPPTPAVMESDEALKERTQMAFEGLSVAGPREAYKFHARSADGRVADASAISPAPCEAVVTILTTAEDGSAEPDLLPIVEAALSDEDVRPVGDRLTVKLAKLVPYRIRATLYLYPGPEAEPILVEAAKRAAAYSKARRRLGRDVNRSAITAALHVVGVEKVDLHEPAEDIPLDETRASRCLGAEIVNGGTRE